MSKRLILHAGMHKTGSSSIQTFLNTAALENATYFKWNKPNHSILFVTLFAEHPEAHWFFRQRGVSAEEIAGERARLREDLRRQVADSPHGLFLFSAERIYGASHADLVACKSFFEPLFDDISVFCYVREPLSYAASMLQQRLKTGTLPGPRALLPQFRKHIGTLDRVFGAEHVVPRLYSDPRRDTGDVVADFCDWTGVRAAQPAEVSVNRSLSAEATALLYLFRKYAGFELSSAAAVTASRKLVRALAKLPGQRIALGPEAFGSAAIDADRAWMERRMGEAFPPPPPGRGQTVTLASFDALDAFGRAVFHQRSGAAFREADWEGLGPAAPARFAAALA